MSALARKAEPSRLKARRLTTSSSSAKSGFPLASLDPPPHAGILLARARSGSRQRAPLYAPVGGGNSARGGSCPPTHGGSSSPQPVTRATRLTDCVNAEAEVKISPFFANFPGATRPREAAPDPTLLRTSQGSRLGAGRDRLVNPSQTPGSHSGATAAELARRAGTGQCRRPRSLSRGVAYRIPVGSRERYTPRGGKLPCAL